MATQRLVQAVSYLPHIKENDENGVERIFRYSSTVPEQSEGSCNSWNCCSVSQPCNLES